MQAARRHVDRQHVARQHQDSVPAIDELSARLTALAVRIDTINGGRRIDRKAIPASQGPAALIRKIIAPQAAPAPVQAKPAPTARQWPRVPEPDHLDQPALEDQVAAQSAELRDHEQRIAELIAVRDRQTLELREAREHVERQALSIKGFRDLTTDRDGQLAELTRRLMQAESDKVELESQLATALRESNSWAVRLQANEGAMHNKAADLSEAHQLIDDLRCELSAAQASVQTQVMATEQRLQRRHELERGQHVSQVERKLTELMALVAERDRRVAELLQDKAAFAEEVTILNAQLADTRAELTAVTDKLGAKNSQIEFLDTVVKVQRDNAEETLKELVAEFDREREEFAAKARSAAAFQHEMAQLLPRLLERRAN